MDGKNRKDIKPGLKVEIVLKKDQRTGKRTSRSDIRKPLFVVVA